MLSKFLKRLDHDRIMAAIRKVDEHSTGKIHVLISHKRYLPFHDEMKFARKVFVRFGLNKKTERNSILMVVFPSRRKVVLFGDEGIHSKLGEKFWNETLQKAIAHFKTEKFTEGILHAIEEVGAALNSHFPKNGKSSEDHPSNDLVEE